MVKRLIYGLSLREFASKYGYNLETVKKRYTRGWTDEQHIAGERKRGYVVTIDGKKERVADIAKEKHISIDVFLNRLKHFYRAEDALRASLNHRRVKNKCT
jgi:DNA-binding transcriptional regulator YhcF (GntR family)